VRLGRGLSVYTHSETAAHERAPSATASCRNPMMSLREMVDRYLSASRGFGESVPLSSFALDQSETEQLFSGYEEDYHISRFLHFSTNAGAQFSINGFPATHVSIDREIETIL
jgi:hypothetical protein